MVVDERQPATLPRAARAPQWWHSAACLALICCALLVSFLG
ncbi:MULTISPECIES: hypothetical protein [Actinosynnema]|nr:hypothetical protein [Actinosynnema pretiosum]